MSRKVMPFARSYARHTASAPSPAHDKEATAAELVRHFAQFREESNKAPVHLTHHGRRTHVLLSVDQYQELLTGENDLPRQSSAATGSDLLYAFADWIDEGLILCGPESVVRFANRVALAICGNPRAQLRGMPLCDALPEISGSLMEVHLRRTIIGGEPCAADIPSPFSEKSWLRLQSFPFGDGIVLKMRDITDDVRNRHRSDLQDSVAVAMAAHGEIGMARLSARAVIEEANLPLCAMLEASANRLDGAALADIVEDSCREQLLDAVHAAIRGDAGQRLEVQLITGSGAIAHVNVSVAPLRGAYSGLGAVLLATPACEN